MNKQSPRPQQAVKRYAVVCLTALLLALCRARTVYQHDVFEAREQLAVA